MQKRKDELFELAIDLGVKIINAKTSSDANKVAIHLLNPDLDALERALFDAETKMFPSVVIHNTATWPYKLDKEQVEVDDLKLMA